MQRSAALAQECLWDVAVVVHEVHGTDLRVHAGTGISPAGGFEHRRVILLLTLSVFGEFLPDFCLRQRRLIRWRIIHHMVRRDERVVPHVLR